MCALSPHLLPGGLPVTSLLALVGWTQTPAHQTRSTAGAGAVEKAMQVSCGQRMESLSSSSLPSSPRSRRRDIRCIFYTTKLPHHFQIHPPLALSHHLHPPTNMAPFFTLQHYLFPLYIIHLLTSILPSVTPSYCPIPFFIPSI